MPTYNTVWNLVTVLQNQVLILVMVIYCCCYVRFKKEACYYFTQYRERLNEGWTKGRYDNIKRGMALV